MTGWIYRRFPSALMAWRSLTRNRLRSALAGLGIVIGVLAIASLGMFGNTLEAAAMQYLGGIGDTIVVRPAFQAGVKSVSAHDVAQIRTAAPGATVVPIMGQRHFVEHGSQRQFVSVYGIERPGKLYNASEGEIPAELEEGAVLGSDVAAGLNASVGDTVVVKGREYRVRAILSSESPFAQLSPNQAVILPPERLGGSGYTHVVVRTERGRSTGTVANEIEAEVNDGEPRITTNTYSDVVSQISNFFRVLDVFLIGVGFVSLVVAGVSILNIMLMSTVERRQEIGVLRAIGVQRRSVIRMILIEAGLLGTFGGVAGMALSILAGVALNAIALGRPLATFRSANLAYAALALAFGVGVSLVCGIYPAWKAANEHPVSALRG